MVENQTPDVRMRGFSRRETVAAAWNWIDANSEPLPEEQSGLAGAAGRVLAQDVLSTVDVPGFDRSAMDGYAVRSEETVAAGEYNALRFRVVGESLPGRPCGVPVERGEAVRIMTGAPIPPGADAVVPAEYARTTPDQDQVDLTQPVSAYKNVGRCGEDIQAGSIVLPAGRKLRPQDVAVVASVGLAELNLIRRPRVRILVTGDELAQPGTSKGPFQIYESNSAMLRELVLRDGAMLESLQFLADNRTRIREGITAGGADVILVSGGSSVGAEDHAPTVVAETGELAIHGIAMRPSSPAGFGRVKSSLVFLLPGNPVSCLCAYDFFAGRAIRRQGGRQGTWPYIETRGTLTRKIASAVGRVDYCRVRFAGGEVEPLALSGASILSSTTRADGFVVIDGPSEGFAAGSEVTVLLYDAAN